MINRSENLTINVYADDNHELDRSMRSLRQDLLRLDIDEVELATGSTPPGAKGDASLLGELVVAVTSAAVVQPLVDQIIDWYRRQRHKKDISIVYKGQEFEISNIDASVRADVIEAVLAALDEDRS